MKWLSVTHDFSSLRWNKQCPWLLQRIYLVFLSSFSFYFFTFILAIKNESYFPQLSSLLAFFLQKQIIKTSNSSLSEKFYIARIMPDMQLILCSQDHSKEMEYLKNITFHLLFLPVPSLLYFFLLPHHITNPSNFSFWVGGIHQAVLRHYSWISAQESLLVVLRES